ncbi:nucleoside hydrolase [Telmatobacter bradus]|uniref:nucleoside hydrolase n=1 Tax=Telmatobacter bradus TaxID=474953 RepID=UPI003B439F00
MRAFSLFLALMLSAGLAQAEKRLVVIDEDATGPGTTNQMAMLALLQAPSVEVLGITTVTGDGWRNENTLHTLRMLELTGHSNIPVAQGASLPLVRTATETILDEALSGKAGWLGAWNPATADGHLRPLPEGQPTLQPLSEDAVHFLIRQVHAHPHRVTIYAGGPLTNIALALRIDPEFAQLTRGLVLMGSSLNPRTDDPEFASSPRHEFNLWFDPEAAHIALRADWPRIDVTTVDVSIQAPFTQQLLGRIAQSNTPSARYIVQWCKPQSYMWDELAALAWIDPSLITRESQVYMDVDLSHGPSYGNTLTWSEATKPQTGVRLVHAQLDVDRTRFEKLFVELIAPAGK